MSIVSVHGPAMFGSKAVAGGPGPTMAVVDPTNGLKWDFKLDGDTTRVAGDFSWAFPPDGTPTPQAVVDPSVVTYASAGQKTATLTVTGAGTGNNPYPPAGVYPITVTAAVGAGPQSGLMSAPGNPGGNVPDDQVYDEEAYGEFILADHELPEIQEFLGHYELSEEDWDALIDEESNGANRSDVLDWINETRP